jgi:Prokaryotic cytochrome b561
VQALLDRLNGPLHLAVALAGTWLVASSPWVGMYQQMPGEPGWVNLGHVTVGFAALVLGVVYTVGCVQGGRWREYFPWLGGDLGAVGRDLAGIFRGRLPTVEGGGLFPMVEGLLLLVLLAAGLTGAVWFFTQGSDTAVTLREQHIIAARAFGVLMLLHFVGVALHLLDFVRE